MLNIQLYNKIKNTAGYIDKDGQIKNDLDTYWVVTDYMQVTPGSTCTYNGISLIGPDQYGAFYNDHQELMSTFQIQTGEVQLTIPDNVFYVRFSLCRQTKINLFSSPLEVGSINDISGSNEAGDSYKRSRDYLDISVEGFADLFPDETYTLSTTKDVYQVVLYFYRETLDHSTLYARCYPTTFDQAVNKVTFTIPNDIVNINGMRVKFYTPDNVDFDVMLNAGTTAIPYVPYANTSKNDASTFQFFIWAEAYSAFREELYDWLTSTLSPNLTEGDLDIIIKLMCYIFGDLSGLVYSLKYQIDPDMAEEAYLKHLGSIIGYEWNDGLTAEEQRESMKLYVDLQKKRGTTFSLKNLIAVFGQTRNSYYSTSDLRGIKIVEGGKDGEPVGTADSNGLYPGDIMIEIPQFSSILIKAIDNIRLIGTRIFFTYIICCGPFKLVTKVDCGQEINVFFDPAYWGYDPTIEEFTQLVIDETGSDEINNVIDWPILNTRVKNCTANANCAIYISQVAPYEKGFVWHEAGNPRYQGFLVDDDTLKDEDSMYGISFNE